MTHRPAALDAPMAAGVIDENPAHRRRRDRHEVRASRPLHARVVDQAHVRFVNERGRTQRVPVRLALQLLLRESTELLVDQRKHVRERRGIARTCLREQLGDRRGLRLVGHVLNGTGVPT